MAKHRVAVTGTVGKSILIDDSLGPRVTAIETALLALTAATRETRHSALIGLQSGNDHPQYPLKLGRETIKGQWDFTRQVWASAGTAAAPGYAFTDDVTTGAFLGSASGDPFFASVVALLHMDGANGGTTFTDSSGYARALTPHGTVTTSSAVVKYGTASMRALTGSSDYVSFADAPAVRIATGDWTVEFWVYVSAGASIQVYKDDPTVIFPLQIIAQPGSTLAMYGTDVSGAFVVNNGGLANFPASTWQHIAAVRSGNTFYLFQDGVLQNTTVFAGTLGENSSPWRIGPAGGGTAYVDEFRMTVGVARYTSNFTPAGPFPGPTGAYALGLAVAGSEWFRVSSTGGLGIAGANFGSSGDYLKSNANASPAWTTPGALTKTDDTNITLTLGGSPTTALLNAASLTLGWTGTLAVTRGGTGLNAAAQGDLLFGSAANTLSRLAKSATATRYLANTGTSNNPAWAQVNLTNGVTGALPAANGGSGQSVYVIGDLLYASTTTALSRRAIGSTGDVLTVAGGVPTWAAPAAVGANPTGLAGMAAVNGTATTFLRSDGRHAIDPGIAPTWTAAHTFGSGIILGSTAQLKSYTVATLPTGVAGDTAYVTDALAPAFGAAVAAGGAVGVPVYKDATSWKVG